MSTSTTVAIPPHKILLVRLKWREKWLDVLSPKEVNLHPRDTQARGRSEKPSTDYYDMMRIHLQVCEKLLPGQALRNNEKKAR